MDLTNKKLSTIPALFAASIDIFFTLFYQKASFWGGDNSAVNEANPIGNFLSGYSIWGLPFICFAWLIIIFVAGLKLPRKIREIFLLFCVIAHSWGAGSWIESRLGFWPAILLFLLNATLYISVQEYGKLKKS